MTQPLDGTDYDVAQHALYQQMHHSTFILDANNSDRQISKHENFAQINGPYVTTVAGSGQVSETFYVNSVFTEIDTMTNRQRTLWYRFDDLSTEATQLYGLVDGTPNVADANTDDFFCNPTSPLFNKRFFNYSSHSNWGSGIAGKPTGDRRDMYWEQEREWTTIKEDYPAAFPYNQHMRWATGYGGALWLQWNREQTYDPEFPGTIGPTLFTQTVINYTPLGFNRYATMDYVVEIPNATAGEYSFLGFIRSGTRVENPEYLDAYIIKFTLKEWSNDPGSPRFTDVTFDGYADWSTLAYNYDWKLNNFREHLISAAAYNPADGYVYCFVGTKESSDSRWSHQYGYSGGNLIGGLYNGNDSTRDRPLGFVIDPNNLNTSGTANPLVAGLDYFFSNESKPAYTERLPTGFNVLGATLACPTVEPEGTRIVQFADMCVSNSVSTGSSWSFGNVAGEQFEYRGACITFDVNNINIEKVYTSGETYSGLPIWTIKPTVEYAEASAPGYGEYCQIGESFITLFRKDGHLIAESGCAPDTYAVFNNNSSVNPKPSFWRIPDDGSRPILLGYGMTNTNANIQAVREGSYGQTRPSNAGVPYMNFGSKRLWLPVSEVIIGVEKTLFNWDNHFHGAGSTNDVNEGVAFVAYGPCSFVYNPSGQIVGTTPGLRIRQTDAESERLGGANKKSQSRSQQSNARRIGGTGANTYY